jgi:hypothetical protein
VRAGVDGGDDLFGVDALQVDRGCAEVRVAELALDHVERHALAGELDGMRVAQLMRREAAPDSEAAVRGSPTRRPKLVPSEAHPSGDAEAT